MKNWIICSVPTNILFIVNLIFHKWRSCWIKVSNIYFLKVLDQIKLIYVFIWINKSIVNVFYIENLEIKHEKEEFDKTRFKKIHDREFWMSLQFHRISVDVRSKIQKFPVDSRYKLNKEVGFVHILGVWTNL